MSELSRRSALAALLAAACTPKRADRIEATLWFSYGGKNREVLLDLVRRFNASQRDFRVVPTYQGDYFEALAKVRTAIAAGVAPSFTHVVGEVVPYLAEANVLEPLDDFHDVAFVPELAQEGAYEGGARHPLVAIPFNRSTPILYVNRTMLDEAGVAIPTTWDELRAAAKKLTRPGRWGYEVPINWWFWVAMLGEAGGELVDRSGVPTLGGAAGEKAIRFWQTLVADGSMRPPPGRDYNAWQVVNQDLLAGRVAMAETSTAFLRYLEENAKFPLVAAPLPKDERAAVPTGGTFWTILRGAPPDEKRAARAFLRFLSEPEQAIDWATRTGYLPVTVPAIERLRREGYYAAHPNDEVALRQLRDVMPWPWSPSLFRIQREIIEPRLEAAVLTNRDAAEVMREARLLAKEPA